MAESARRGAFVPTGQAKLPLAPKRQSGMYGDDFAPIRKRRPASTIEFMGFRHVSQTAFKVGIALITLNQKPGWKKRLPKGLIDLTERLLLAASVLGYGRYAIALSLRLAPRFPQVKFFEFDRRDTSFVKENGVNEIGEPENMTLLAADLATHPLSEALSETDSWNTDARVVAVAEGLFLT